MYSGNDTTLLGGSLFLSHPVSCSAQDGGDRLADGRRFVHTNPKNITCHDELEESTVLVAHLARSGGLGVGIRAMLARPNAGVIVSAAAFRGGSFSSSTFSFTIRS